MSEKTYYERKRQGFCTKCGRTEVSPRNYNMR